MATPRGSFTPVLGAARLLQAVDLLFARPALTAHDVESALAVNLTTAQRYVAHLERAGILRVITGRARGRVYQAGEVVVAIGGPLTPAGRAAV